ncbi:hypothetical protein CEXT_605091, partial [Caerostris extrusa]
ALTIYKNISSENAKDSQGSGNVEYEKDWDEYISDQEEEKVSSQQPLITSEQLRIDNQNLDEENK